MIAILALFFAGCGPGRWSHVATDPRWLDPVTGSAVVQPTTFPTTRPIRIAVYGDTRGNPAAHRQVVDAIRQSRPDLVIFTGDALDCVPRGHMPDWGAASLAMPLWPQYLRGYPGFSLLSVMPFPALLHEAVLWPARPIRDREGFNGFLRETAELRLTDRVPLIFVPGNHDLYHRADRREVARLFGLGGQARGEDHLWYSLDVGAFRLIVLDTGADLLGDPDPIAPDGPQLRFLREQLADADARRRPCILAMHLPPFTSAAEDGPVPSVRQRIVPLIERSDVPLVICGHAHAYERIVRASSRGDTTYVVSGGGGAPFHHQASQRVPGSAAFIALHRHFVLLELDGPEIRGRVLSAEPPRKSLPLAGDEFHAR